MKTSVVRITLVVLLLSGLVRLNPPGSANLFFANPSEPLVTLDLAASPVVDPDPRDETSIAVSLRDERFIVGVSKVIIGGGTVSQGETRVAYYSSSDGGRTWTTGIIGLETPQKTWSRMSDPSVASDLDGNFYLCVLVRDNASFDSGVYIFESTDDGRTFKDPVPAVFDIGHLSSPKMADKCYMTVDGSPTSAFKGSIYVAWVSTEPDRTVILTSHRAGGAATFSDPKTISHKGDMRGPTVATGPNGEFYAAWEGIGNPKVILFNASTDGGETFFPFEVAPGTDFVIHNYVGSLSDPNAEHRINGVARMQSFPVMDVDRSTGPNRGMIYVAWAETRNHRDADIFIKRLTPPNGGRPDVGNPVRGNSDTGAADPFFSWVSVDASSGLVWIAFFAQRDDPESLLTNLYVARSTDGGVSFSENTRLSSTMSDPRVQANVTGSNASTIGIGDYVGIAALQGKAHSLWADTRHGKQEIFYGQVSFNGTGGGGGGGNPLAIDACASPRVIDSQPFEDTVDTTSATSSPDDPISCSGSVDSNTIWYTITPSVNTVYAVDTRSSGFNTVVSVLTGLCGSLTSVACNDDFSDSSNATDPSLLNFQAFAGTTYLIEVSGKGTGGSAKLKLGFPTITEAEYVNDGVNPPFLIVRGAGFRSNSAVSVQPPNGDAEVLDTTISGVQGDGTATLLTANRKKLKKLIKAGKTVTIKVVPANGTGSESEPFLFRR